MRAAMALVAVFASVALWQSMTRTTTMRAAPMAPAHDAASSPPPPAWMAQSSLDFNAPAHHMLTRLSPSRATTLHLTIASSAMADWVENWRAHAERAGLTQVLVGAADTTVLELCADRWGLAAIGLSNETRTALGSHGYIRHQAAFLQMGLRKVSLLLALLLPGFNVLMSDLDVIWLRGEWHAWMVPSNVTKRWDAQAALLRHADVLVSTDELDAAMDAVDTSRGPGDTGWHGYGMRCEMNTGVLFFRGGSRGALALAHAWRARIARAIVVREPSHDQVQFLRLVRGAQLASVSKQEDVWAAWVAAIVPTSDAPSIEDVTAATRDVFRSGLAFATSAPCADGTGLPDGAACKQSAAHFTIGTLPAARFASGHLWYAQSGWADDGVAAPAAGERGAQAVHLTFGFGDGADYPHGKRQRAREAGLWLADDEIYYGHGGGGELFVTLSGRGYEETERAQIDTASPEWSPRRHVDLAGVQLRTVERLLELASALNATLIMPPLMCACDRYWGLLRACRHPDAPPSMRLPFRCPMDAMINVARWHARGVRFREAGFLSSPRIARDVLAQSVRVFARNDAGSPRVGAAEARFAVTLPSGTSMSRVLPLVRRANRRARLIEISLKDLRGLCAPPTAVGALDPNALASLLSDPSVAYCPEEDNRAFPGWSRWDGKHPQLNCSRGLAPSRSAVPSCARQ